MWAAAAMSVVQKRKLLLSELAALGKSSFTTSWSAKDHVAASAHGGDLSMGEDGLNEYGSLQKLSKLLKLWARPVRIAQHHFYFREWTGKIFWRGKIMILICRFYQNQFFITEGLPWSCSSLGIWHPWSRSLGSALTASSCGIVSEHRERGWEGQPSMAYLTIRNGLKRVRWN